jgi:DNA-binding transcriptional ArsR family regulator
MNISSVESVSNLLQTIGPSARLQILLAIGAGETCVCHLEAMLGLRQAALSQHLMALRQAGVVSDRRQGRYIHYRLRNPALLDLIHQAAEMQNVTLPELAPSADCCCPDCSEERVQVRPCCGREDASLIQKNLPQNEISHLAKKGSI